jgi:hypothetical protein
MHWTADTENGDWIDDPDEAQLAGLIAGLGKTSGTFITLTPASQDATWYASVSLLPDGTTEVHRGHPGHGEDHKAITTDTPAGIARDLTGWLANR